eukprot:Skav208734  [mRNA]  locus=scaffold615:318269:321778:+ [translate_table: standard]
MWRPMTQTAPDVDTDDAVQGMESAKHQEGAILILLGPVLVRCIRRSERQNLTDLSLTDVMADDSESSMGDLCSKGMVFGCQPSTICESDGRYCMLKSEQDLLVGFDEKKSAVVAAAQAYKEDQYLADLWDYVNNLWDVSLYSKAVQESAGELSQLMSTVNASVRDLNTAAIRISDGISAGLEAERQAKTFSKEDLFQAVKKMIPGLSSQEVEVGAEKWDAALAQEPLCENPLSFNCSKKLLRKLAPATFQTVAKLYSEIKSQDSTEVGWFSGRPICERLDQVRGGEVRLNGDHARVWHAVAIDAGQGFVFIMSFCCNSWTDLCVSCAAHALSDHAPHDGPDGQLEVGGDDEQ